MVSKAAQAAYEQQRAAAAKTAAARASLPNNLLDHVERKIATMKSESQYFDEEDLAVMPKFELEELTRGAIEQIVRSDQEYTENDRKLLKNSQYGSTKKTD